VGGREEAQWTVLWHAIPEDRRLQRQRLVRRLRFLGFGQVQDGAWIAPHDREQAVATLIEELDVKRHVGLMLARPAVSVDVRAFVGRVWDLDDLDARYRAFVADFDRCNPAVLGAREAFMARTRLVHTFRQFAVLDAELPESLIPVPEHREPAVRLFHDLYPALAPAAQRYFDVAASPAPPRSDRS
jgi:phenylacetic acid degradation operon negative regulatory protein